MWYSVYLGSKLTHPLGSVAIKGLLLYSTRLPQTPATSRRTSGTEWKHGVWVG